MMGKLLSETSEEWSYRLAVDLTKECFVGEGCVWLLCHLRVDEAILRQRSLIRSAVQVSLEIL
jgi:hypothetical protein